VLVLLVLGDEKMVRAYGGGVVIDRAAGGVETAEELEVDAELDDCWNDRGWVGGEWDRGMNGDRRSGGGGGGSGGCGGGRLTISSTGIGTGKDRSISPLRDIVRRFSASGAGDDASELSPGQTRPRGIVSSMISILASRVSALGYVSGVEVGGGSSMHTSVSNEWI
jgi:hypothetical protein